ncbi:MAG: hypothetical protein SNJ67_03680 [Chloracidobacterium sp.]|uniref:Ketohydroxyglutarate aldolase n=1 Tax=Chloracidobacterium validum TaxID=2821543 RepID=A0ABX8BDD2_9BACT|nr:hypothetical protein [Chloracidobacterium validum]QUW03545.1 hypothetical protein J8C06_03660 [Chloracidobacterium validum]
MSNAALPSSVAVVISLTADYRERMSEVVAALRVAGLNVTRQLHSLGQITGTVSRERLTDLERVPGVAYVEQSGEYHAL